MALSLSFSTSAASSAAAFSSAGVKGPAGVSDPAGVWRGETSVLPLRLPVASLVPDEGREVGRDVGRDEGRVEGREDSGEFEKSRTKSWPGDGGFSVAGDDQSPVGLLLLLIFISSRAE